MTCLVSGSWCQGAETGLHQPRVSSLLQQVDSLPVGCLPLFLHLQACLCVLYFCIVLWPSRDAPRLSRGQL